MAFLSVFEMEPVIDVLSQEVKVYLKIVLGARRQKACLLFELLILKIFPNLIIP